MSIKLAGLAGQAGDMKRGSYTLFPIGDYRLTVKDFTAEAVKEGKKTIAVNVVITSVVDNCENLPENEDPESFFGKTFKDRIYVMTPNHEKYDENGDIGLNQLKSFLNAIGVKVSKDNAFNEKAIPGKEFEITMGTNTYVSKKTGKNATGNQVNEYRPPEDDDEEEEEVIDAVEGDDDSDLEGLDDDLGLGVDLED